MLPIACHEEASKDLLHHTLLHDGSASLTLRAWAETSEVMGQDGLFLLPSPEVVPPWAFHNHKKPCGTEPG